METNILFTLHLMSPGHIRQQTISEKEEKEGAFGKEEEKMIASSWEEVKKVQKHPSFQDTYIIFIPLSVKVAATLQTVVKAAGFTLEL